MSLEDRVRTELLAIRKSSAGLTVAALSQSPVISGLLGNGDPLVAYNSLKHAVLSTDADIALKAAMSSLGLSSDKLTHLGRLDDFGTAHGYEQRHVRRYSDKGIRQLARLIVTNWSVQSSPCLDVTGYQTGSTSFAFTAQTRRQYFIEMRPLTATLYCGDDPGVDLALPMHDAEDGIWTQSRLKSAIQVSTSSETSIFWMWRGELWPKFSVQWRTDLEGHAVICEMLGNSMMIRLIGS